MSERAAAMLKEDMEYMGPLREKDRDERQQKIVKIIKHLDEIGEIVIPRSGEVVL
jgi:flagellar motor switch protein FliG